MPPDSTAFFQPLLDPQQWTLANVATVVSAIAAVASAFYARAALWPILQQRRTQAMLEKSFGSELYGSETIERSTRYYVPPNCSSVDPAQEAEIRQVVTTEEKLFEAVDKHLAKDNPHRHLLLLADSGMGKSSFMRAQPTSFGSCTFRRSTTNKSKLFYASATHTGPGANASRRRSWSTRFRCSARGPCCWPTFPIF